MHPNWRALATVDFKRKIFIRETETSSSEAPKEEEKKWKISTESGLEAKEFYEDVLQEAAETPKVVRKAVSARRREKSKKPFNRNLFFRAAVANDEKTIREMDLEGKLEEKDDYGWTGLMMAACEGSEGSFRLLLGAGASLKATDGHGNSAESLARKKGHRSILEAIEEVYRVEEDSEATLQEVSPHFCEICRVEFKETSREEHETSTLHQFSRKSCISFQQRFPVSNSNRGCRIMVKQGWNKRDGLGPTGSGRLFPVKTVLKRDRRGVGGEQNPAKVTHFAAQDPAAVAGRRQLRRERTRKEIHREFASEKERERRFRHQLS